LLGWVTLGVLRAAVLRCERRSAQLHADDAY